MVHTRSNKLLAFVSAMFFAVISSTAVYADNHGSKMKKGDIVDTAVAAGQFNTLAAALEAADLVSTLKGEGPFTVFAPTDAAFAKLPDGTVESLLKPENRDQLVAILTYHVVPGKVTSKQVVNISEAKTVNGSNIAIRVADGNVRINDATVIAADVDASNGVIHVIDTVILPN
ncbi:MAG: fasciclin domain-containing protein [Woeseiaceae bacterium]|nr:fasciclin domain-containing protein [Woeseiaceae bacterium]